MRDRIQRARLIGLNREAQAMPLPPFGAGTLRQRRENVERKLEPLALLGIDRQVDAGARGRVANGPSRVPFQL